MICQKSKVDDWVQHFREHYTIGVFDLTSKKQYEEFFGTVGVFVGVINYDLIYRRPELLKLHINTLMLDESSIIQNRTSKRSKAILSIDCDNVILLSGTPCSGAYERLWSQIKLLGWNISEDLFYKQYVDFYWDDSNGFPLRVIKGYKNVDRLKAKLREHGCHFLKTEEVFDLPDQIHNTIRIDSTSHYKKFKKDRIVTVDDITLIGDTTLTKMLYERQLCGSYNPHKLKAFRDLVESTNDRLIVFYSFNDELHQLDEIAHENGRSVSFVNGHVKNLTAYENDDHSITFIQYQSGSMGLNLQKANKIIYFTPPLSSELFEQSKKRTHRIGQSQTCFYYYLTCKNSVEERIYDTLAMRRDFTDKLFINEEE